MEACAFFFEFLTSFTISRAFSIGIPCCRVIFCFTVLLAEQMGASLARAGYRFSVVETHHVTKLDKPSGTAISIAEMVERGAGKKIAVPIESVREGDAKGTHVLAAVSDAD